MAIVLVFRVPASAASNHPRLAGAMAEAYRYDDAPPQPAPAPEAPAAEPAGRPRKRVENSGQRIPGQMPATAPVGTATLTANGTLMLPKMVVPGAKGKLPASLPLLYVRGPVRNVGEGDAFETPAGRRARLVDKYSTASEKRMAKVLSNSLAGSAEAAEAAAQLNDLAYLIELALAAGLETPEEQKDIRAAYYQLLAPKPQ